jgi:NAD(P)H-flavin reductase
MVTNTNKQCLASVCTANRPLDNTAFELQFDWAGPAPRPGQFFMVRPLRSSVFLGRPISVADFERGADEISGCLTFLVAQVGRGTRDLALLHPGEEAELTGPLGNSFLDFYPDIKPRTDHPITYRFGAPPSLALIGGGIGVAPLLPLYQQCEDWSTETVLFAGFKTKSGLEEMLPPDGETFTEDGSSGTRGFATSGFCAVDYDAVFACGPLPMLKVIAAKCVKDNTPCFVSMENRMACGVGACLGCTIPVRSSDGVPLNRRCCADGPVFNAREVIFD